MRVHLCGLLIGIILIPQIGSATDVGYQLPTDGLAVKDAAQSTEPAKITFVNRTWAAPGIEQADRELLPPQKFDPLGAQTFRTEILGSRGWTHDVSPQWVDEVAWPRTREIYGLGHPGGTDGFDDRPVFSCGLVKLVRIPPMSFGRH